MNPRLLILVLDFAQSVWLTSASQNAALPYSVRANWSNARRPPTTTWTGPSGLTLISTVNTGAGYAVYASSSATSGYGVFAIATSTWGV